MDNKNIELLDFKVTDLQARVNTALGQEMQLRAESRVAARTPEPADGTLYLFLNVRISDGETNGENYLFDLTTTTVLKLPEGVEDVPEEDAQPYIEISRRETYTAIRKITEDMGMVPLDLNA